MRDLSQRDGSRRYGISQYSSSALRQRTGAKRQVSNQSLGIQNFLRSPTSLTILEINLKKPFKKSYEELQAALPAKKNFPSSEQDWRRLQKAAVNFNAQIFIKSGLSKAHSKELAQKIHGGPIGRIVLTYILDNR